MASWSTRFLLICFFVCFVASTCEARGGRGGRFRSSRYRYRGSSGGYNSGGGGEDAGKTIGIIFGALGGFIALVVIFIVCKGLCKAYLSSDSSSSSIDDTVLPNTSATTPSRYHPSQNSSSLNNDFSKEMEPPSYDSVVNQKEGALPYSTQPNGSQPLLYSSQPAFLADAPPGMFVSPDPNPATLPYLPDPTQASVSPSAPSEPVAPGPVGFEHTV